jgi:hypothetical protein
VRTGPIVETTGVEEFGVVRIEVEVNSGLRVVVDFTAAGYRADAR